MRAFELNQQVRHFTEMGSLRRLDVVIQDTRKVITRFNGIESIIFMALWNQMKPNQFALVFDYETRKLLGYVSKNEYGIPVRYLETEELTFDDMYQCE